MAEEHNVTLHGMYASPYSKRVELALKVKGISYEYVEEDLSNKSHLLLKYNPVYKKVPVLVHNGKSLVESLVILEYVDEVWPNTVRFLPDDPFKKSQVRFWAAFFQQHVFETIGLVLMSEGETQEKAIKEYNEKIGIFEQGAKELFNDGTPFDGENVGLLDILLLSAFGVYKGQEEVLGIKVIDPETCPTILSRLNSLFEMPAIKETIPPFELQVEIIRGFRARFVKN